MKPSLLSVDELAPLLAGAVAQHIEGIRRAAEVVPQEEIPRLLGALEETRVLLEGRYLRQPTLVPVEDRLLTVAEVAERLSVSKDYVYRNAHRLPFGVRQGRLVRFSSVGLERYLQVARGRHQGEDPTQQVGAAGRKQEAGSKRTRR